MKKLHCIDQQQKPTTETDNLYLALANGTSANVNRNHREITVQLFQLLVPMFKTKENRNKKASMQI